MVKRILPICAWTLTCLTLAISLPAQDESARQTALEWLRILDLGDYKEAAGLMSQDVRGTKDWLSYFNWHRAALGNLKHRQLLELKHLSTIPTVSGVRDYAVLNFKSSFDRKSDAQEQVVLGKTACCWEVFDYQLGK